MKAPKFPLYPPHIIFCIGYDIVVSAHSKMAVGCRLYFLNSGAFQKIPPFYLPDFFFPLEDSINNNTIKSPADHYRNLLGAENTLCVAITEVLKSNDFQHRFYGKIVRVDQKNHWVRC